MRKQSSHSPRIFFPSHSREQLVSELRRRLPSLAEMLPLRRVILFGSWASGRATAFSDIDLLVIYGGQNRIDAFSTVRRCLALHGLEPDIYSDDGSRPAPTIGRMTAGGIELL